MALTIVMPLSRQIVPEVVSARTSRDPATFTTQENGRPPRFERLATGTGIFVPQKTVTFWSGPTWTSGIAGGAARTFGLSVQPLDGGWVLSTLVDEHAPMPKATSTPTLTVDPRRIVAFHRTAASA